MGRGHVGHYLPRPVFRVVLHPPRPLLARVPLPLPFCLGVPLVLIASPLLLSLPVAGTAHRRLTHHATE